MTITLEGYKNIIKLGSGGFGNVYVGEEELSEKKVAIKQIRNNLLLNRDFILNEIRTISQFNHPNIVQYHVAFVKADDLYFVMEYCPGGSLANAIHNKNIDFDRAIEIVLCVAKALEVVNNRGVIHNDIKPDNLLIGENNEIKIGDFGVSNTNIGTLKYLPPPKQINSVINSIYHRDIYALGITFIELLLNKRIFIGMSDEERANKILSGDLGINHLPLWVQEIVMKMLSVNPDYQFKSMSEIVSAIETQNMPFVVDEVSLTASVSAKQLQNLLKRNKYYTLKKSVENLNPQYMNHSSVLEVLGKYYLSINNYKKSKEIFLALKKKVPSININKELGMIYLESNSLGLAIRHLTEYLLLHPDDCEAYNLLLECYFKADRHIDGRTLCEKLLELFPKELCFKINIDLFEMMLNLDNLDYIKLILTFKEKNKISEYNKWVVINKSDILSERNNIKDKLIFCHYSISKSFTINKKYQIIVDGVESKNNNMSFISVGRSGFENDISLNDTNISRKQAILILMENENWIYDLNGASIFIDGEKLINRKRLFFKHDIQLGEHLIELNTDRTKLF